MPKNIVNDILPPEKRSIRNIPIPEKRKIPVNRTDDGRMPDEPVKAPVRRTPPSAAPAAEPVVPPQPSRARSFDESPFPNQSRYGRGSAQKGSKKVLWAAIVFGVLIVAFAVSSLFESARVRLVPKQANAAVSGTFTASADGGEGTIPFQIVKVTRDGSRDVAATAEQEVKTKASGTIVIYNNHSSAEQRLVANTRFQSKDGLIFRIEQPVTVPGATIKDGEKIPGSIEAVVVADEVGEKYNIGLSDFTIPGFKGDPKFETFYARSKTPMTGGFAGMAKVVSDDVLAEAKDEIQFSLKEQLAKDVESQIPHNFMTFDSSLIYSFVDLPQSEAGENATKINIRGELYAVIFDKAVFANAIGERFIPDFAGGGDLEISNPEAVGFVLADPDAFNPSNDTKFDFTLNGNAHIVWLYDEEALKQDLAGAAKSDVNRILAKYPSVEEAQVTVTPVWKRSLPKDVKKIKIDRVINDGQ